MEGFLQELLQGLCSFKHGKNITHHFKILNHHSALDKHDMTNIQLYNHPHFLTSFYKSLYNHII